MWHQDIHDMHAHYGVHSVVAKMDAETPHKFLCFRAKFIGEELAELYTACEQHDAEEVVDALIDICVVAIGTLDLFGVDAKKAWEQVHRANMSKQVGVKDGRPNPLGLPDLTKPEGWVGPDHSDNHGAL
jgi:phosphoribosyl-ATP pyrophosphohydrolase